MDLHTITEIVTPTCRADLHGGRDGDAVIAGGTWLMSEPQLHLRRLIDLQALNWPAVEISPTGLRIAATATIEQLISTRYPDAWRATDIFTQAAHALLASYKIWHNATVGGNICLGFPAGSMISVAAALDARLLVWRSDGSDETLSVPQFVTDIGVTALKPGDILRAIDFPATALTHRTSLDKVAVAPRGRSGTLVVVRDTGSEFVVTVTAATRTPHVRTFAGTPEQVADSVIASIPDASYYTDAHGEAQWRKATAHLLIARTCATLLAGRDGEMVDR